MLGMMRKNGTTISSMLRALAGKTHTKKKERTFFFLFFFWTFFFLRRRRVLSFARVWSVCPVFIRRTDAKRGFEFWRFFLLTKL